MMSLRFSNPYVHILALHAMKLFLWIVAGIGVGVLFKGHGMMPLKRFFPIAGVLVVLLYVIGLFFLRGTMPLDVVMYMSRFLLFLSFFSALFSTVKNHGDMRQRRKKAEI